MAKKGYDVIVVGTRVSGAATAMLLARQGVRVLALDRATFPSDTLSTHQVQLPGVARLRRWGLLDQLAAAGTPATRRVRFDSGGVVLEGQFPPYDGIDALYGPRRTVLDAVLVDAARAAGAEVRDNFVVKEVIDSGGRVTGIRGFARGRPPVTETARLVVGADGKHSLVAAAVRADRYRERPALSIACYTYWSGLALTRGEIYQRPGRAVAAFPTNDDLAMVYVAAPIAEFNTFRQDIDGHYLRTLDRCGDLGERVRSAVRAERLRTTPDLPNAFHVPYGPGWALVGDAGLVMDPITAQGIGNALRDAELLVCALVDGLGGKRPLPEALARYWRQRDAGVEEMYDLTARTAAFRSPRRSEQVVLASMLGRRAEIERFLGVFAGTVPPSEVFGLSNILRLVSGRVLTSIVAAGMNRCPLTARAS